MKNAFLNFLLIIFCIACFCSIGYMIFYQYNLKEGENYVKELKRKIENEKEDNNENTIVFSKSDENDNTSSNEELQATSSNQQNAKQEDSTSNTKKEDNKIKDEEKIIPKYKKLYDENNDFAGWVQIEGTALDYPVMYTPDNPKYYEHKNWEKNYAYAGLPFIQANCSLESDNITIYAHNMKNGSMFRTLMEYDNEKYYKEHQIIKFDTLTETGTYQIIAVYHTKVFYDTKPKDSDFVFYDYINFETKEDFDWFIDKIKELSLYDIKDTAEYGDKLITLSTCHYHTKDGRINVVAKKIE